MISSEKSHQHLSDYNHFLFKKRFKVNKKGIISSRKMRKSGNYSYDYAHSFFGEDFQSKALYLLVNYTVQKQNDIPSQKELKFTSNYNSSKFINLRSIFDKEIYCLIRRKRCENIY